MSICLFQKTWSQELKVSLRGQRPSFSILTSVRQQDPRSPTPVREETIQRRQVVIEGPTKTVTAGTGTPAVSIGSGSGSSSGSGSGSSSGNGPGNSTNSDSSGGSGNNSGGLTTDGKVALGVAIPGAILALIGIAAAVRGCKNRKKRKGTQDSAEQNKLSKKEESTTLPTRGYNGGVHGVAELPSERGDRALVELPGSQRFKT